MEILENSKEKDWAKCYKAVNFIEKGVCTYQDEVVCLSQETLQKCVRDIKGKPVIIKHQRGINPDNMQEHAVGYVTGACFDEFNASFSCDFVLFDEEAKGKIANGWSVSCAYLPKAFGQGGTWHNTAYDREITDLEFTHLALVPDPRYEDAKVYENSIEYENGKWITVHPNGEENKGRPLLLKDGETPKEAIHRTYGRGEARGLTKEEKLKRLNDNLESSNKDLEKRLKSVESAKKIFGEKHEEVKRQEEQAESIRKYIKKIEDELNRLNFQQPTSTKQEGDGKVITEELKKEAKIFFDNYIQSDNITLSQYQKKTKEFEKKYGVPLHEVVKEINKTNSEKQNNNKEDEMDVNEFISKITDGIVERFNACKKNEMDEEEKKKMDDEELDNEDDDKLEYDGETYSKKELVNAFKKMKKNEADAEEAKKAEQEKEEKENALGEEAFKKLEELLNSRKQDDKMEKIKIESQADRIARGKEIFG